MLKKLFGLTALVLILVSASVVSAQDFSQVPAKGKVTMVDLGAKKCIPCKMMAPIMAKLEKAYEGKADIVFIDVWENRDQAPRFGIRAIPTQIFFNEKGEELGTDFLRSPIPFGRVTSRFSYRRKHPILKVVRPHLGVDLAAPVGTPVMAASGGKIIFRGRKGGYGKLVIMKHPNGYKTYYGHLSRFRKGQSVGSKISQKDIIGYVGSTGLSTGPHLDYRISHENAFRNPFSIEFKPRSVLTGEALASFSKKRLELARLMNAAEGKIVLLVKQIVLGPDSVSPCIQ